MNSNLYYLVPWLIGLFIATWVVYKDLKPSRKFRILGIVIGSIIPISFWMVSVLDCKMQGFYLRDSCSLPIGDLFAFIANIVLGTSLFFLPVFLWIGIILFGFFCLLEELLSLKIFTDLVPNDFRRLSLSPLSKRFTPKVALKPHYLNNFPYLAQLKLKDYSFEILIVSVLISLLKVLFYDSVIMHTIALWVLIIQIGLLYAAVSSIQDKARAIKYGVGMGFVVPIFEMILILTFKHLELGNPDTGQPINFGSAFISTLTLTTIFSMAFDLIKSGIVFKFAMRARNRKFPNGI